MKSSQRVTDQVSKLTMKFDQLSLSNGLGTFDSNTDV